MANLIQDDPADTVTTHPAAGGQPATRNDKRGLLHMLHDEIADRLGLTGPKTLPVGPSEPGGDPTSLEDAVNQAITGAKNANPDNP